MNSIDQNYEKIRTDSYNALPITKIWTFHNTIILIESVVDKNKCCNNIFLEKDSYKCKFNKQYF